MDTRQWLWMARFEQMGVGYDEYVCFETNECKQVFDDGHEEVFEMA